MYIQSYPRQKFTLPQLQQAYGDFLSNRATMSATFVQILCSVNIIEAKSLFEQNKNGWRSAIERAVCKSKTSDPKGIEKSAMT